MRASSTCYHGDPKWQSTCYEQRNRQDWRAKTHVRSRSLCKAQPQWKFGTKNRHSAWALALNSTI